MYFEENMKPKAIANKLRLQVTVVQAAIDKFKKDVKSLSSPPKPICKVGRKKQRDNPIILDAIDGYIKVHGIYDLTAAKVHQHLVEMKLSNKLD